MDIFMYGMFLLPLAVFVIVYAAEQVGAPNWYLILTGVMFGFVLTSVWRWVNDVPVEYISIPELWAVNVLVSLAALALFYIVKSLRRGTTYQPIMRRIQKRNRSMSEETPENDMVQKDESSVVPRLTEEQAAIMMAFTGISCGPFELFYRYAQEKLDRPVRTHEFATKGLMAEINEASREDFFSFCCLKKYDNEGRNRN